MRPASQSRCLPSLCRSVHCGSCSASSVYVRLHSYGSNDAVISDGNSNTIGTLTLAALYENRVVTFNTTASVFNKGITVVYLST